MGGGENLEDLAKESGLTIIWKDYYMFETGYTEQYASEKYQVNKRVQEVLKYRPYGEVYQFILGLQKEEYVKRYNIVCKDKFPYVAHLALCAQRAELDELLREQRTESEIERQSQVLEQLMCENKAKDAALADIEAKLEQIISSRTWRYGSKVARTVRKVFRPGSLLTKLVAAPVKFILKQLRSQISRG